MKNIMKKQPVIFLLFFFFHMHALIVQTNDVNEIMKQVQYAKDHQEILVVFDIDNTIAQTETYFGGDEWFSTLFLRKLDEGLTPQQAAQEILPTYFFLQENIWLKPVQSITPHIIKQLQQNGIATIALTSRSKNIMARTFEQLAHIGVSFIHNALHQAPLDLSLHDIAHYENGVIFTALNNKGEVLLKFFNTINYWPTKVIFIDDKMKYVEQVATVLESHNIEFVGLRYGYLDNHIQNFDLQRAHKEMHAFLENNALNINKVIKG